MEPSVAIISRIFVWIEWLRFLSVLLKKLAIDSYLSKDKSPLFNWWFEYYGDKILLSLVNLSHNRQHSLSALELRVEIAAASEGGGGKYEPKNFKSLFLWNQKSD